MNKIEKFAEAQARHEGFYIKGSIAQRFNNPGNLIFGPLAQSFGSTSFYTHSKTKHDFAIFPTPEQGWKALYRLIENAATGKSKVYSPEMTILEYASKYSPVRDEKGRLIPNHNYANSISKQTGLPITTKIKELMSESYTTDKRKTHLFAHMDRNFVKKGDRVIQYVTPIGTIGTGNGQYFAHLHFSLSTGLTPAQLKAYVKGWSKEKVQTFYHDPRKVDFNKMFGTKVDVGNFGYDWLQWTGSLFHPGVDVNGLGGGNSDIGMAFKSSCNGVVIDEWRGWTKNGGWGNWTLILED